MRQQNGATASYCTETNWKGRVMPRSSEAKPGTQKTSPYGTHTAYILSKMNNAKYLSLIDASSKCHNLKLNERSSTSQHLHANLTVTDTRDCYSEHPTGNVFQI